MKNKIIPILLFLFLYNLPSFSYWHKIYHFNGGNPKSLCVAGDSANLYALFTGREMLIHSQDLGRTWDTLIGPIHNYNPLPHFKEAISLNYAGEGYLYILYNTYYGDSTGTGIKRFDTRTNELVDSIKISDYSGAYKLCMFDSINGILRGGADFSITHDGWKTYSQVSKYYDYDSIYYHSDDVWFQDTIPYGFSIVKAYSMDSLLVYGHFGPDMIPDRNYFKLYIEKDSLFNFKQIGKTFPYTRDSNFRVIYDSLYWQLPSSTEYINDSTWFITAKGERYGESLNSLDIYKTIDRGETYEKVCSDYTPALGLYDIAFRDSLFGVAVGNMSSVITTDGGESWEFDRDMYNFDWSPNHMIGSAQRIWIVDNMVFITMYGGEICKYEEEFGADVKEEYNLADILIYPNPALPGKKLNFKIENVVAGNAEIFDMQGHMISRQSFAGDFILLPEDIASGSYFLVIESGGYAVAADKFIVE